MSQHLIHLSRNLRVSFRILVHDKLSRVHLRIIYILEKISIEMSSEHINLLNTCCLLCDFAWDHALSLHAYKKKLSSHLA